MADPYEQIENESTPLDEEKYVTTLVNRSNDNSADDKEKKRFTLWVRNTYTELYQIPQAQIIMKIVARTPNVEIFFTPAKDTLTFDCEGLTRAEERKIYIAAGGFDNDKDNNLKLSRNDAIKSLIIHEFCHFAVHVTFCNAGKAFYLDDKVHEKKWKDVLEECYKRKKNRN